VRRDYGYSVHVQHAGCWSLSTATIVVKVASGAFGMVTNIASTTADMLDSVIRNNTYKVIMTSLFPTCQCGPGSTVRYPPADVLKAACVGGSYGGVRLEISV